MSETEVGGEALKGRAGEGQQPRMQRRRLGHIGLSAGSLTAVLHGKGARSWEVHSEGGVGLH